MILNRARAKLSFSLKSVANKNLYNETPPPRSRHILNNTPLSFDNTNFNIINKTDNQQNKLSSQVLNIQLLPNALKKTMLTDPIVFQLIISQNQYN